MRVAHGENFTLAQLSGFPEQLPSGPENRPRILWFRVDGREPEPTPPIAPCKSTRTGEDVVLYPDKGHSRHVDDRIQHHLDKPGIGMDNLKHQPLVSTS